MHTKKNPSQALRMTSFKRLLSLCAFFLLFVSLSAAAQTKTKISGSVISALDNEPLLGVTIVEKGTSNGVSTDVMGLFEISVAIPCELVFNYIGYHQQTISVTSADAAIRVKLEEDVQQLEEVVVIGYGVQKKKLVTGATIQVKGSDIEKLNTVNVLGALQSQTPGVNIVQQSGMPGEGFKVNIRGLGTIGSSGPLYIIDGVTGGNINTLNPADIESVDVLKDAASAAIYGSRAANGVILVTTKKGRSGKVQITYDGYYGIQNPYKLPDLLNAQEYATIMNEAYMMDGKPLRNYAAEVPRWNDIKDGSWEGTNWLNESLNPNAPTQNHAVNITGGNDRSVYSLGFSYTSQEGIIGAPVTPNYQRYTARINTEHVLYKKNDLNILTVGENLNYSYGEKSGIAIGDMYSNDIRNMMEMHPFQEVYDEKGQYTYASNWNSRIANPIALMDYQHGQNLSKTHSLQGNVFAVLQPIKGLTFRSNFGYSMSASSYRSYKPAYKLAFGKENAKDITFQSMSVGAGIQWDNTLAYEFQVDKHSFSAMIGQSIEKNGLGEGMEAEKQNSMFSSFKYAYLSNASDIDNLGSVKGYPWGESAIASFFGRVNYSFADKYMFTAVLRADGSSNFAPGNRWGYFPSVSAGWVISGEDWMEEANSAVSFLKLRASWGQNGNQAISPFQYVPTIAFTTAQYNVSYNFGGNKTGQASGAYPDVLANPDLKWETSEQINIGLDARFLSNRLSFTFDYYIKDTKDWLVVAPALASNGTGAPYINGGDIRNEGIEAALSWNDAVNGFRYNFGVNMAYNKNQVTRIANSEQIIHGGKDILSTNTTECYRAEVGMPIGYFYGYSTAGIFQTQEEINNYQGAKYANARPGDVIWVDRDGNGEINENDKGMIGKPNPDFTLGFNVSLAYKGFDLNMTMYGAFGGQVMKSYRSFADNVTSNYTSEIFGRWNGAGTSNHLPRLSTTSHTNATNISDLYVENSDYFRMQNISFGYDFKHLIKSNVVGQLRLYVAAQNLFTLTNYSGMDPEVGYGGTNKDFSPVTWASGIDLGFYPSPRTLMVGLNLTF